MSINRNLMHVFDYLDGILPMSYKDLSRDQYYKTIFAVIELL